MPPRHEKFTDINGKSGLHILGISYEPVANFSLAGWFYAMPNTAQYSYLEADYHSSTKTFSYAFSLQGALQDFRDKEDTKTLGLSTTLTHDESGVSASLAYNKSYGGVADNGYGGGAFFTSSENMTLADHRVHGEVFFSALAWDVSEKLTMTLSQASLHDANRHDGYEIDGVLHYDLATNLSFDAIYSKIDNTDVSGDKFDNVRVFANYTF